MKKKLRALLNSSSFYAGLALCLLAVGVGGYALFSGGEQTDPAEDAPEVPVTAPVPEEAEPPAVEAAAPAEVETLAELLRQMSRESYQGADSLLRLLERRLEGRNSYTVFGSQTDPDAEIHIKTEG